MKRYNSMEVEVIKLSVCNIESLGLSIKDVLMQSVVWLREKYEMTGDARGIKEMYISNLFSIILSIKSND